MAFYGKKIIGDSVNGLADDPFGATPKDQLPLSITNLF
jgi:hypothetical protein